jgi:hypothetical protein
MAREIIINVNVEGTEQAVSNVQKLEQEIEQLNQKKAELLSAPSASSGEFVDRLEEIDSQLNKLNGAYESATGKAKKFEQSQKTLEGVSKTIAGSIGIASSAMATFGVKNEEVEKALLKVQAAAALATGIKDLSEGYKALTTGLNLAKVAQIGFNAAMLANPYVLAAAAVVALVAAIVIYANSTDDAAMSEEEMKEAVDELTDSLEKQEKALDSNRAQLERRYNAQERTIEREIALLKAKGATEEEIAKKENELFDVAIQNSATKIAEEKENLLALIGLGTNYAGSTDALFQQLIKQQVQAKTSFITNQKDREETSLKLTEKYQAQFNRIIDARNEREDALTAKEVARLQRQTDAQKKARDKAKTDGEKSSADAEKAEKERERIRKETTDNILKDLDVQSKAIAENNNKELDNLKLQLINGDILEETFAAEKVLLNKKTNQEIIKFRENFQITKEQQDIIGAENEKAIKQKNGEEVLRILRENDNIELGIVKANNQAQVTSTAENAKNRIDVFEKEWLQKKIDLLGVEGLKEEELADAIKKLELDKNKAKLETLQVGSLEYLSLKEQIAQQERAIDKKTQDDAIKNQKEIQDATIELAQATLSSLSTLSDIYFENQAKKVKGNAKEEEKLARKQFQINKALQLGTAIINGVNSILAITSVPDFTLGVQSAIRIGAQVALNAASIAKIIATKFEPNSTGASSGGGTQVPSLGVSGSIAPTTFQPSAFGTGISQQQTFGAQQGNGGNVLRAYVSESDLTTTQNRLFGIRNASEL